MKLLFIENNPFLLDTYKDIMSEYFNEIITVTNGKDGIEKYKDIKDIDLILSEVNIPIMHINNFINEVYKINKNQNILFLIDKEKDNKIFNINNNMFIEKPLSFNSIEKKLKEINLSN